MATLKDGVNKQVKSQTRSVLMRLNMKKPNALLLFFLIVTFASPIGVGIGFMVGKAWNSGGLTGWRRLPDPPTRPVQIVGGSTTAVLIATTDSQVFYCDPMDGAECWVKYDEPVFTNASNEYCTQWPLYYSVRAAPGEVIDYLQTKWCHFEAGEETDYALLKDGSLWMWHHFDANFLNLARVFGTAGVGCSIGFLAAIAVTIFNWRRDRVRQAGEQIQNQKVQ